MTEGCSKDGRKDNGGRRDPPGGRPRWKPSSDVRELVKRLASFGIVQSDIAKVVGISEATLQRRCRDELRVGTLKANAQVAIIAFEMAVSGEYPMMTKFWLERRLGWSEKD